jgi:hypothetical protein
MSGGINYCDGGVGAAGVAGAAGAAGAAGGGGALGGGIFNLSPTLIRVVFKLFNVSIALTVV